MAELVSRLQQLREAAERGIEADRDFGLHDIDCTEYNRTMSEYSEEHADPDTIIALLDGYELAIKAITSRAFGVSTPDALDLTHKALAAYEAFNA